LEFIAEPEFGRSSMIVASALISARLALDGWGTPRTVLG
jgi:hypothetical protein